jgi:hypothetical protein
MDVSNADCGTKNDKESVCVVGEVGTTIMKSLLDLEHVWSSIWNIAQPNESTKSYFVLKPI